MGVVDKHGVVCMGIQNLDAPGHAFGLGEQPKHGFKIQPQKERANRRAHRIVYGEMAGNSDVDSADIFPAEQFILNAR